MKRTGACFFLSEFVNEEANSHCMHKLSRYEEVVVVLNNHAKKKQSYKSGENREKQLYFGRLPAKPFSGGVDRSLRYRHCCGCEFCDVCSVKLINKEKKKIEMHDTQKMVVKWVGVLFNEPLFFCHSSNLNFWSHSNFHNVDVFIEVCDFVSLNVKMEFWI